MEKIIVKLQKDFQLTQNLLNDQKHKNLLIGNGQALRVANIKAMQSSTKVVVNEKRT